MNEVYSADWYASNEMRAYPLSSLCSRLSAEGSSLPDTLLVDLKVTGSASDVFVSGLMVTDQLITLVLSSSTTLVATLTLQQPVAVYKNIPLESYSDGIGGFVVFGNGALLERGYWNFSSSDQSGLDAGCQLYIRRPPIRLALRGSNIDHEHVVDGTLILRNGNYLKARKVSVPIGTVTEECSAGLVRYNHTVDHWEDNSIVFYIEGTTDEETDKIALQYYNANTCNSDPYTTSEPGKCGQITSIAGVTPDSSGNINIVSEVDTLQITSRTIAASDPDYLQLRDENDCAEGLLEFSQIIFEDTTEKPEKTYYFGNCGEDLCETDSTLDTPVVHSVAPSRIPVSWSYVDLQNDTYPVTESVLVYSDVTGLGSVDSDNLTIIASNVVTNNTKMLTTFNVSEEFTCGISDVSGHTLAQVSKDHILLLGRDREVPDISGTLSIQLNYQDSQLKGIVRQNGSVLSEVTLNVDSNCLPLGQIFIKHCYCTGWRYE